MIDTSPKKYGRRDIMAKTAIEPNSDKLKALDSALLQIEKLWQGAIMK